LFSCSLGLLASPPSFGVSEKQTALEPAMDWLPLFLLWLIGAGAFVAACYANRKRKP